MSMRRGCDVNLLEQAHLYPWVASGFKLIVMFVLIVIFNGK